MVSPCPEIYFQYDMMVSQIPSGHLRRLPVMEEVVDFFSCQRSQLIFDQQKLINTICSVVARKGWIVTGRGFDVIYSKYLCNS